MGIREQYAQIYVAGINDALFQQPENYKRRVVSKGALFFYPRLFVGPVGHKVYQELVRRDGPTMYPSTCLYYDAAYLYFYATDFLVRRGYDYEDPYEIVKAMRGTYFHGCSGFVKIEKGLNDRTASEITIINFQYNSSTDQYSLKQIGSFNPFSIQPYQITSPIQWPDDISKYADLKPYYQTCPFLAETVRDLPYGGIVGVAIGSFLCVYSLVIALVLERGFKRRNFPLLKQKSYIFAEDFLVLFTVFVDFFQFAALSPDLEFLSHSLKLTCLGLIWT